MSSLSRWDNALTENGKEAPKKGGIDGVDCPQPSIFSEFSSIIKRGKNRRRAGNQRKREGPSKGVGRGRSSGEGEVRARQIEFTRTVEVRLWCRLL